MRLERERNGEVTARARIGHNATENGLVPAVHPVEVPQRNDGRLEAPGVRDDVADDLHGSSSAAQCLQLLLGFGRFG